MTTRTHKMIDDTGETDTGKMPSVSHDGSGMQSVGPACKMFFPMTEVADSEKHVLKFQAVGSSVAYVVGETITGSNSGANAEILSIIVSGQWPNEARGSYRIGPITNGPFEDEPSTGSISGQVPIIPAISITDPVPTINIDLLPIAAVTFVEANAVTILNGSSVLAGTLPVIGIKPTLFVACIKYVGAVNRVIMQIGGAGSDYFYMDAEKSYAVANTFTQNATSIYKDSRVIVADDVVIVGTLFNDGTMTSIIDGEFGVTDILGSEMIDMQNSNGIILSQTEAHHFYGFAVFQFETMPSNAEISEKVLEMKADWIVGNKRLPADWVTKAGA